MNEMNDLTKSEKFLKNRDDIVRICYQAVEICNVIGQPTKAATLEGFQAQMADEHFRVMVLGSFKRGKSTFINAMLGAEVLPNYATPCTAVINEVKWGDEKQIHIHFKSPLPTELPEGLTSDALVHINKHIGQDPLPPIIIPPDQLEHYVVIPDPSKDQAEGIAESPFSHAEVFWPLPLCRNGIEIIDSPGLDEHESRSRVTEHYLMKTDVVLFVQTCTALAGKTEMDFITNNLIANGYEDIIFVCNRFDEVKKEEEKERVKDYARKKLGSSTKMGEKGLFFLSAANALDGRLETDTTFGQALVAKSGILPFEKFLFEYLFENKAKIKIIMPARKMLHELVGVRKDVRAKKGMLSEDLETLRSRANTAHESAVIESKRVEQFLRMVEQKRVELRDQVYRMANRFYQHNYPTNLRKEIDKYQLKAKVGVFDAFNMKTKTKQVVDELTEALGSIAGSLQNQWCQSELTPFVRQSMETMVTDFQADIDDILGSIDQIRANVSGIRVDSSNVDKDQASGINRLLSGAGGFFLSGPTGAMLGATFGYKEMAKNFGVTVGIVAAATFLLGPLSVPAMIALVFAGGSVQGLFKMNKINEDIKKKVAETYLGEMQGKAAELAEQIANQVHESSNSIVELLSTGLYGEIQSIVELADAAVRDKEKGEDETKRETEKLNQAETALDKLHLQLTDLITEMAL